MSRNFDFVWSYPDIADQDRYGKALTNLQVTTDANVTMSDIAKSLVGLASQKHIDEDVYVTLITNKVQGGFVVNFFRLTYAEALKALTENIGV